MDRPSRSRVETIWTYGIEHWTSNGITQTGKVSVSKDSMRDVVSPASGRHPTDHGSQLSGGDGRDRDPAGVLVVHPVDHGAVGLGPDEFG
jgi:hypothetical protein